MDESNRILKALRNIFDRGDVCGMANIDHASDEDSIENSTGESVSTTSSPLLNVISKGCKHISSSDTASRLLLTLLSSKEPLYASLTAACLGGMFFKNPSLILLRIALSGSRDVTESNEVGILLYFVSFLLRYFYGMFVN